MGDRDQQIQMVTRQLRIVFKEMQAHLKAVEKECGLSGAKLWMLHELSVNPGPKVSQLAAALAIHASTCSNMLDKLEDEQLIHRDRSKKDQRSVHLYITEKGKALLAKAPQPVQGKLSHALEQLTAAQLTGLESGLEDLINALHASYDIVDGLPLSSGE